MSDRLTPIPDSNSVCLVESRAVSGLAMRDARCATRSSTRVCVMRQVLINQYMEVVMRKAQSGLWFQVALCGSLLTGCAPDPGDVDGDDLGVISSAITAIGDPLPGTDAAGFAEAK